MRRRVAGPRIFILAGVSIGHRGRSALGRSIAHLGLRVLVPALPHHLERLGARQDVVRVVDRDVEPVLVRLPSRHAPQHPEHHRRGRLPLFQEDENEPGAGSRVRRRGGVSARLVRTCVTRDCLSGGRRGSLRCATGKAVYHRASRARCARGEDAIRACGPGACETTKTPAAWICVIRQTRPIDS